jgi:2-(1,2-epoxy-1,2-dihydrophenyl)acetyl-CoA isomerase
MNPALSSDLEELLEYEVYAQEIAGATADHKEGLAAFSEKRPPEYIGK